MVDVKKKTSIILCLIIILVFLIGCQEETEISDKELEAELEQMSDEELKSILEEGEIEESKNLVGQASKWTNRIKIKNRYSTRNKVVKKIRQSRIILDEDFKIKQASIISSSNNKLKLILPKDLMIYSKENTKFVPNLDILEKKQTINFKIQEYVLFNIDFSILSSVPMTFSEPVKMTYELSDEEVAVYSEKSSEDVRVALLNEEGELLQYVPFTLDLNTNTVEIWITHTYFDSIAILSLVGNNEWASDIITSDGVYFSQQSSNPVSICIWDTPKRKSEVDGMLGQSVCAKECGSDLSCDGKQPGDNCVEDVSNDNTNSHSSQVEKIDIEQGITYNTQAIVGRAYEITRNFFDKKESAEPNIGVVSGEKICDPNCGCVEKSSIQTCSDNVKNQGETGVDCGGPCAPCNTKCTTGTNYGLSDFGCTKDWSDNDGMKINFGNQVCDYKCNIFEVCSPEIDYVIQEASDCCAGKLNDKHSSSWENGCDWTVEEADSHFNGDKKSCRALYLIRYMTGLNIERKYMRYGFLGGMDCVENNGCGIEDEQSPLIEGLQCKGKPKYLVNGIFEGSGWNSNTDMSKNYCWIGPQPAHAMINVIEGGICIDNSISLVTLLRKAGFSYDNVGVVGKPGHATVLLKFPGDNRFHQIEPSKWNMIGYVYHSDISSNLGFVFPPGGSQETICTFNRFMNDKLMENAPSRPIYNCNTVTSLAYGEDLFCGEELSYGVIYEEAPEGTEGGTMITEEIVCGDNMCKMGVEDIENSDFFCRVDCDGLVCGDNMCKAGIEDNPASYYYCSADCP